MIKLTYKCHDEVEHLNCLLGVEFMNWATIFLITGCPSKHGN